MSLQSRIAELVPKITGWCSVEKANDLAMAVIKLRSTVTVEVGVWGGRSLIGMALAHSEQQHGVVWAIDPWSPVASQEGYEKVNADWWGAQDHEGVYQTFLWHLKTQGVERYVNVIREKSDDVEPPDEISVAHLDGQHTDQTIKDVERFASKVVPNGLVFLDDLNWSGGGVERGMKKLLTMGFGELFKRDTGAMFQRMEKKAVFIPAKAKKNKGGRPKGSKNKKRMKKTGRK